MQDTISLRLIGGVFRRFTAAITIKIIALGFCLLFPFISGTASASPYGYGGYGDYPYNDGDIVAPVISNVNVIDIADQAVTISWDTSEPASTRIEYGETISYGSSTPEINTNPRVTQHTQTIYVIENCTSYHFRVISTDGAGNTATGNDGTFTTILCPTPTATPTATVSVTATATPTVTVTTTTTPTATVTATPTVTPTVTPTTTPTPTSTPNQTGTPNQTSVPNQTGATNVTTVPGETLTVTPSVTASVTPGISNRPISSYKILITDAEGKALANTTVEFDGKTYTTDGQGYLALSNVTPGKYQMKINGLNNEITIKPDQTSFILTTGAQANSLPILPIILAVSALIIIGVIIVKSRSAKANRF